MKKITNSVVKGIKENRTWPTAYLYFQHEIKIKDHESSRKICDTMKRVRKADDLFACFGTKSNKGLSSRSSTRSEVGWGTPVRELEKGTQRRQLLKGDAEGQSTTDSRRDLSARDRVQEQ